MRKLTLLFFTSCSFIGDIGSIKPSMTTETFLTSLSDKGIFFNDGSYSESYFSSDGKLFTDNIPQNYEFIHFTNSWGFYTNKITQSGYSFKYNGLKSQLKSFENGIESPNILIQIKEKHQYNNLLIYQK